MKVVINRCYGGFGLSPEAILRIIEANSKNIIRQSIEESDEKESDYTNKLRDGYYASSMGIYKDGFVYSYNQYSPNARADPALVKIVAEIGSAANGTYADLKIVDIPDNVSFIIEEYDGMEIIAEWHRTWS